MTDINIYRFMLRMDEVFEENKWKKGDSWKLCDLEFLHQKLVEEIHEYFRELKPYTSSLPTENIQKELVDIANCCMMLHNRLGELK